MHSHEYRAQLDWTGSTGEGIRSYSRDHHVSVAPGVDMSLSADPAFRGNPALANPEQLLVAAASSCQMLSFLGASARAGVDIVTYEDDASGEMPEGVQPMSITEMVPRPRIRARGTDAATLRALVARAHDSCFVANSLRSTITIEPEFEILD